MGQSITVTASGFDPGEAVSATLFSTPRTLGTRSADDTGRVTVTFEIRADDGAGAHRVVLVGATSGTVEVALTIAAAELPATGAETTVVVVVAAGLLTVGALAIGGTRSRRRTG